MYKFSLDVYVSLYSGVCCIHSHDLIHKHIIFLCYLLHVVSPFFFILFIPFLLFYAVWSVLGGECYVQGSVLCLPTQKYMLL